MNGETYKTFPEIKHVIWDADQTLWDWVGMHLPGLEAIIDRLTETTPLTKKQVHDDMREVYRKAKTLDYPPLLQEMGILQLWHQRKTILATLEASEETAKALRQFNADMDPESFQEYFIVIVIFPVRSACDLNGLKNNPALC